MSCPLCTPEKKTQWYDINSEYWYFFDCDSCKVPMAVLKRHSMDITDQEKQELYRIIETFFPGCHLRTRQRKIKDHLHYHIIRLVRKI